MTAETETNTPLGCFITNQFGDRYLYEVNHNTLNHTGADDIHGKRFGKLVEKEDHLFIVIGSDSGTLITYLNESEIASGTRFILVEIPEVLKRISEEAPFEGLNENVTCIPYKELQSTLEQLSFRNYTYLGNVQIIQSLCSEYGFLPEYQELSWMLQTDLQKLVWQVEATLGTEPFRIKQLENLGDNLIPSCHLRQVFNNGTAILLAGGPSLDDILPWVKSNRDSLCVMAVSRISRRLQQAGIIPDMVFSIDPHMVSFDISKEMLLTWEHTIFVHTYHVVPQLLGQWRGISVYLGQRLPWDSPLNKKSLPHAGPTVSNTALSVAMEMGFSRIILAGVDLCHAKSGYTHASGSNEHEAGPQLGKICTLVETYGGWEAETTSDFATAIDILDHQARNCADQGVELINPAPGAAKIPNIRHIPPEQITLGSFAEPPFRILNNALPKCTDTYRISYLEEALKEVTQALGQLLHVKKLAKEAIRCSNGLFGRNGMKRDFKFKKRMDKIENKLNRQYAKFSRLAKEFGIRDFLKLTRIDAEREWEEDEMEKTSLAYYQAYADSADRLIRLIKKSKKRLQERREELREKPDMDKLVSQWREDNQPGRSLVWLTRKGLSIDTLPGEYKEIFLELQQQFNEILTTKDTAHMKRCQQYATLSGIRGKALAFFRQQNVGALEGLVSSLQGHPDPQAKSYLHLASGYLYELTGDLEKALDEYQKLFSNLEDPLLEDCLRRVASLSLSRNDIANGLLALESLTNFSPTYLVQYGDLLRLTGSHQDAVNTYLAYLEKIPGDISLMFKLGKYYSDMGIEEGARTMYNHILSLDPGNETAQTLLQESTTGSH